MAMAITTTFSEEAIQSSGSGPDGAVRPPDPKCGLSYRLGESGLAGKDQLPATMAAPATRAVFQSERVIGTFRFLYDTVGSDAPAMLDGTGARIPGSHEQFVDSAGAIFNAVYALQTGALGYADPVQPGQGEYDVYIFNNVYYGETVPGTRIGTTTPARYITHINIDNDFQYFYSAGMAGLRVTAAHEFFHAIQFGSYGYWNTDVYFMELSSTWMEDVVYGDVNDYYQYIRGPWDPDRGLYPARGHFARPDFSLLKSDGLTEYSRAILGKFIERRYSPDVIRRSWEMVPDGIAVDALDRALGERGSSFREAFLQWSVWNGRTGPGADTAEYTEGREYPRIVTAPLIDYVSGRTIADTIYTTSVSYYPVNVAGNPMSVIVANLRTSGSPSLASFRYEMADGGDQSFKKLSNGIYVRLDVPDPSNWSTVETAPAIIASVTPAPNPFSAGDSRVLDFHIPMTTRPSSVILTVLGVGMARIFQGPLGVRDDLSSPFVQVAEWDARDSFSRPLSSGVYIYVLTVDGAEHTGKFSVVR